jgi:hypothetical protein
MPCLCALLASSTFVYRDTSCEDIAVSSSDSMWQCSYFEVFVVLCAIVIPALLTLFIYWCQLSVTCLGVAWHCVRRFLRRCIVRGVTFDACFAFVGFSESLINENVAQKCNTCFVPSSRSCWRHLAGHLNFMTRVNRIRWVEHLQRLSRAGRVFVNIMGLCGVELKLSVLFLLTLRSYVAFGL